MEWVFASIFEVEPIETANSRFFQLPAQSDLHTSILDEISWQHGNFNLDPCYFDDWDDANNFLPAPRMHSMTNAFHLLLGQVHPSGIATSYMMMIQCISVPAFAWCCLIISLKNLSGGNLVAVPRDDMNEYPHQNLLLSLSGKIRRGREPWLSQISRLELR